MLLVILVAVSCYKDECVKDWLDNPDIFFGDEHSSTDVGKNANIGNGMLGVTIGSDVFYLACLFNGESDVAAPRGPSHRAALPFLLNIEPEGAVPCGSAIDIQRGVFHRRSMLGPLLIDQAWYTHQSRPGVMIHNMTLTPPSGGSGTVTLTQHFGSTPDVQLTRSTTRHAVVYAGSTRIPETDHTVPTTVALASTPVAPVSVRGTPVSVVHIMAVSSSTTSTQPTVTAQQMLREAASDPTLYPEHVSAMRDLWASHVDVSGNPALSRALRASQYYINNAMRADVTCGISPGGMCSNSYNGHTFWDQETWVMPVVAITRPDAAKAMLDYRVKRLNTAIDKAHARGLAGALYPWESASTGIECTPPGHMEGECEVHINADITLAVKQYVELSGDVAWLKAAMPMLEATAEYWVTSAVWVDGEAHYYSVQPPDEKAGRVEDSTYTNAAARAALRYTASVTPSQANKEKYTRVADGVFIPYDSDTGIHPEYVAPAYDGHLINQADVGLLYYPLREPLSVQQAVKDLTYWEAHTNPDGYFTGDSAYAIAWLRAGRPDKAEETLTAAVHHIAAPFNTFMEKLSGGHLNFITGAGGFLQNIVFGCMGVDWTPEGVAIHPLAMPPQSTEAVIRQAHLLGAVIDVVVTPSGASLTCWEGCSAVELMVDGRPVILHEGFPTAPVPDCLLRLRG